MLGPVATAPDGVRVQALRFWSRTTRKLDQGTLSVPGSGSLHCKILGGTWLRPSAMVHPAPVVLGPVVTAPDGVRVQARRFWTRTTRQLDQGTKFRVGALRHSAEDGCSTSTIRGDRRTWYAEHRSCWAQFRLPQTVFGYRSAGAGRVPHSIWIMGPGSDQVQGRFTAT